MTLLAAALSLATPLLSLAPAGSPTRAPASSDLAAAVESALPRVVEIRRDVHAHPELGERETRTAALVAERLRELGLEVREGVAVTGVIGVLRGARPGGVVAYRADMDALPITEQTTLPFKSTARDQWDGQEVGVMHACGHDMHVAIALGVAEVLAAVRDELPGTVVFLFQPVEEGMPDSGSHGARRMVELGALKEPRVQAIFGLHVNPALQVGKVSVIPRGALAAVDRFRIDVQGQQSHGAYPEAGVDPIVAASQIVLGLQTIASRNVDTHETVVVTVGKIAAGNRFNIIPGEAQLLGTIRTHEEAVRSLVHERIRTIAEKTAEALGATATVEIEGITPATVNDPELVERMLPSFRAAVGEGSVAEERPHMGGEDFAFFANEVPGFFYFVGTTDVSRGKPAPVHTPFYDPDERALEVGVRTSSRLLWDFLASAAQ